MPLVNLQVGCVLEETVIVVGVPTLGVTVTVLVVCAEGPLQPLAVTRISTFPENPLAHVITPVDELITPAAVVLSDQLNPVLFVAVVA